MCRHLLLPLIAAAAIAIAADDPAGWSKARWGMSDAQILQAFDGQAVRAGSRIVIPSIELAGARFRVTFQPDKAGHLHSVVFTAIDPPTDSLAQAVEELLASKYGHPWKTQAAHTTDTQWAVGATVIQLTHTHLHQPVEFQLITLRYALQSADPI
jgi:hypothetical protein